uniref:Uncharacterized protein n=1 Tax=Ralstonia solanacearum TaxID=305 RepID=A0A0S4U6K4_RALSL|nr:protein of unknown function [Ralstonia solanacearum]
MEDAVPSSMKDRPNDRLLCNHRLPGAAGTGRKPLAASATGTWGTALQHPTTQTPATLKPGVAVPQITP